MKSFVFAFLLFALVVGTIVCNALYINKVANDLTEQLDAMPDIGDTRCAVAANRFYQFWIDKSDFIGLTVSYPILDRITEQAALLSATAQCRDFYGYRSALALLYDAIEDMRRLEDF